MTRLAMPVFGLAILLAAPMHAQAHSPRAIAGASVVPAVDVAASGVTAMERAESLALAGNYRKAARVYRAAADEALREGLLPEAALWQEAAMHFALSDCSRAALALDRLAALASDFGNPVVEARAKLNAAVLYAQAGEAGRAMKLAADLRVLRNSPFLGDDLRADIDMRLGEA